MMESDKKRGPSMSACPKDAQLEQPAYAEAVSLFLSEISDQGFSLSSDAEICDDPENGSQTLLLRLNYKGAAERQKAREVMTRAALPFRRSLRDELHLNFVTILD